MAITLQTLKHGVANREASATRFSVYYKRGTTPSNNIIRVKNIIHDIHNESVSYSVLVAYLCEHFLAHHRSTNSLKIPESS